MENEWIEKAKQKQPRDIQLSISHDFAASKGCLQSITKRVTEKLRAKTIAGVLAFIF